MADSFADLFRGYGMSPGLGGYGGDQGGGFGGMSNSLIGLGMGLMQPYNPWAGTNAWTNALSGYQTGAALDQRARAQQQQAAMERARLALAQSEAGRQASQFQQEMELRKQQFALQQQLPAERQADVLGYKPGTPERQSFLESTLRPKEETLSQQAGQRQIIAQRMGMDLADPAVQNWIATGSAETLKPKEPSAHAQASIEKADDTVLSAQNAIHNLNYAKSISPQTPAGILGGVSEAVGGAIPSLMSQEMKNRVLLRQAVTGQALEQLRAIFGGNPTEGERKVLLQLQGSVDQPDDVRQKIFDDAIELANKRIALNQQRAQQLRGGTYYKPGGGGSGQAPVTSGGSVRKYNPQTGAIE